MKKYYTTLLIHFVIILILGISLFPIITGSLFQTMKLNYSDDYILSEEEKELDLLYGEIIFEIQALENTASSFNISYSVPPNYENQVPIMFELLNDTNAKIISYRILNDTNYPNKIVNFTIAPMHKGENATFHFVCWVLVKNNDYNYLPRRVKKPWRFQLPEEAKTWLTSTKAIQSDNLRIKLVAWSLKGFSRNMIKIANRISFFTGEIIKAGSGLQDALSTLKRHSGVCTGKANLGTALFRANGIPAKDIAVMPTWSKNMWFDMHYICQYYCHNYGWVFVETSLGITPYEPKNNIVMRVHYPEDENRAGDYGGVELWFWTNNENIDFPYIGPTRRAWIEKEIITEQPFANNSYNITKYVYELHTKYIGINLSGENLQHFNNAIVAQKSAIACFNQSDVQGYYNNMTIAYDEYNQINYP